MEGAEREEERTQSGILGGGVILPRDMQQSLGPSVDTKKQERNNGRQREGQRSGGTELISGERSDEGRRTQKPQKLRTSS